MPEPIRPLCRNYTTREFRPAAGELDIDFVLHRCASGHLEGTAARWARQRALEAGATVSTYIMASGEASFATGLRADLSTNGIPKDNIDLCAYWRVGRDR